MIVALGVGVAWRIYRNPAEDSHAPDPLGARLGGFWNFLERAMGFDAFYERVVVGPLAFLAGGVDALERMVFVPLMGMGEACIKMFGRCTGASDEIGLNKGFNGLCRGLKRRAVSASRSQTGRPQGYLRAIGLGLVTLLVLYFWLLA